MNEIICTTQAELDAVATDFDGRVIIKFGTLDNCAVVNRRFKYSVVACDNSSVMAYENSSVVAYENSSVVACDNSSVVARGNSSVVAYENSSVVACENSSVVACENSSVVAWDNSSVEAWDNSIVVARDNSSVAARGNSSVVAYENSSVVACDNSSVVAYENSSVVACENSSVVACENSSVEAWDNSSVVARDNSSVVARGNSQVVDAARRNNIKASGNARVVYNPSNVEEYIDFYGLESTDTTVKLYKAVHFYNGIYHANYDNDFTYTIGETVEPDNGFSDDVNIECGTGIHLAYRARAVSYGANWGDLAILECECEKSDVLVPLYCDGKVRARKAKVLREVPLEECGLYGKMLAKRRCSK